jgi:hypothetical protein
MRLGRPAVLLLVVAGIGSQGASAATPHDPVTVRIAVLPVEVKLAGRELHARALAGETIELRRDDHRDWTVLAPPQPLPAADVVQGPGENGVSCASKGPQPRVRAYSPLRVSADLGSAQLDGSLAVTRRGPFSPYVDSGPIERTEACASVGAVAADGAAIDTVSALLAARTRKHAMVNWLWAGDGSGGAATTSGLTLRGHAPAAAVDGFRGGILQPNVPGLGLASLSHDQAYGIWTTPDPVIPVAVAGTSVLGLYELPKDAKRPRFHFEFAVAYR